MNLPTRRTASLILVAAGSLAPLAAQENPLLNIRSGTTIPFDKIKPEHVAPAVTQLLAEAEQQRKDLKATQGTRTWDNTMEPLERLGQRLDDAFGVVRVLESVATTPELRKAFNEALGKVDGFFSGLPLDPELAALVKQYSETAEARKLKGARARALKVSLDQFRRNGAYLAPEKRKRLEEINTELSKLSAKFGQNVVDSTGEFELIITDEKQLAGLPESARQAAAASAKSKGKQGWRFTLQAPSVMAVQRFLDDRSIREKIYRASSSVAASGATDNNPIIQQELKLRREKASLLGYRNFADFQTEERMAKSGANVKKFLEELEDKSRPAFDKENAELQAFRKSLEGPDAPQLEPWDLSYYAEKMRKQLFSLDEEELRPYFPIDKVFDGMFALVNRIYGITVKPVENPAVWHPDVKFYEVRDNDGTLLASFYSDWFPRETKRPGAWMNGILVGGPQSNGRFVPHVGMICGNVTAPVEGKPALLTHREVETVFHEFGHLLHQALSRVPVRSLSGTNVAWDFVELPSQIMENFTWEKPVVELFGRHYQSGEVLPDKLFDKLLKIRNYRSANAMMRQLGFGTTDILLHTDYRGDDQQGPPAVYARRILQKYTPAPLPENYSMLTSFGHLFAGGYAAGYYSYKWSEVLDADAFTRFKEGGVFSREVGNRFRRAILEQGNSEDAGQLFREFMGRDPDVNALLKRSGLDFNQNMK